MSKVIDPFNKIRRRNPEPEPSKESKGSSMSFLSQVKRGKIKQPILTLIYGPDGLGKSTFGSEAPNPIFLGTERGTYSLDVARFPAVHSLKDFNQALTELLTEEHPYKTLVIDSLDWLEPLVWEQVVFDQEKTNIKSIEDIGYARGYIYALDYWRSMQGKLTQLRDKGMNIVLVAHATVKEAKDPSVQADYNRYQLKLHDKAAALWREYVDSLLFINLEVATAKDDKGKMRAYGDGTRFLFTETRPAFHAKNRDNLPFQIQAPLGGSWQAFIDAIEAANPDDPKLLMENIKGLLENLKDTAVKAAASGDAEKALAENNIEKLKRIYSKLQTVASTAA